MSAFKQLLASDIIVTPYRVSKTFNLLGAAELTGSGVDRFFGTNITGSFNKSEPTTGQINSGSYQRLVYNSAKQLYYSNYLSSSYGDSATPLIEENGLVISSSAHSPAYDNYLQTTLTFPREFPSASMSQIGVISIPKNIYGDLIYPGSFRLSIESAQLIDDGEGNIRDNSGGDIVGNITYAHGTVILYIKSSDIPTGATYGTAVYGTSIYGGGGSYSLSSFITGSNVTCSFSSSYEVYQTQYKCTLSENEYNFTLNPTITSGSSNTLYSFATGSDFTPYVTTVGLYNDGGDLLAVGKMAQPIPTTRTTDMTFYINLDIV